ncbi:hypothetical protein HMPREF0580_0678 [Mobiluncus mulieris ATCC 35239]|uniref:AAA domain-containing protein n=2 Tax=Mobiluncus mulieris TaxID=2052 RepID=E0QP64_9ACTO|nr:ATP-binding protein [Mobiluncus mulieris]EFM46631.1 hypothetical protein HMPREF0580_0678 [Mobiluncus mulieris ATCC 35239]MCU9975559.1 ATP-binding protein [Mobiluncus mulieris]MCU9994169.1 ATP-binding protein [Mobiluncus mulieris]MCV0013797.1 ATP-binding protein [Mobiluncus mulieris]
MSQHLMNRQHYLDQALLFRDTDLIKVVTGVRRCGKSSLLALIRRHLERESPGTWTVELNLESMSCPVDSDRELYDYFRQRLNPQGRSYFFLDEPQRIKNWQNAVNAMRVDFDCDIYLTGSNAYLLSSEFSTYLSGRYVEIKMLPLAFGEYADFCGLSFAPGKNVTLDESGEPVLFEDFFAQYLRYGGMPALAGGDIDQEKHALYLSSLYEAVASRDIVNRERNREQSRITNPQLLRDIAVYLADNIGNLVSASGIANTLTSAGMKTTHPTAASYIEALNQAFLFYRATRYDLHGKAMLRTNPKHYIVDLGLRSFLGGYRVSDAGRIFENAVYLELLFRGYAVHVGKIYGQEIDFVAIKDSERLYIQATDDMPTPATQERELAPLRTLRDSYPKLIVTRKPQVVTDFAGIRVVSARDFFLGEWR